MVKAKTRVAFKEPWHDGNRSMKSIYAHESELEIIEAVNSTSLNGRDHAGTASLVCKASKLTAFVLPDKRKLSAAAVDAE